MTAMTPASSLLPVATRIRTFTYATKKTLAIETNQSRWISFCINNARLTEQNFDGGFCAYF
jgi:hypothetical protein